MGKYLVNWKLYRLFHESTPDIVYIGITSSTLEKRLLQHRSKPHNPRLRNWIAALQQKGYQPRICLLGSLASADRWEAEYHERLLILRELEHGKRVLNSCHLPRDYEWNDDELQRIYA